MTGLGTKQSFTKIEGGRSTIEFTGAERLHRAASGGLMGWASLQAGDFPLNVAYMRRPIIQAKGKATSLANFTASPF